MVQNLFFSVVLFVPNFLRGDSTFLTCLLVFLLCLQQVQRTENTLFVVVLFDSNSHPVCVGRGPCFCCLSYFLYCPISRQLA
jgi:hypothetical protein